MRTVSLEKATASLSDYVRESRKGDVIVTKKGKPVAAIVSITKQDIETLKVSSDPRFQAIMKRSRMREKEEGSIPEEELRRRLGP